MSLHFKTRMLSIVAVMLCVFQVHSRMSRYDAIINMNWKFVKGDPSGAQNPSFDDGSWETVSVPHSASYDKPMAVAEGRDYPNPIASDGELKFYGNPSEPNKTYWYRKTFTCPANARKVFIQFEGIMQTAMVYVNGTKVGEHLNTGYTGFFFDISDVLLWGESNCIAVRANINNDHDIPPGGSGGSNNQWATLKNSAPDYLLFSGMYRNVRLLFKDSVYVPLRGQRIAPAGSTTDPIVHAVTYVNNDAAAVKTVAVTVTLFDAAGNSVVTKTASKTLAAHSTDTFNIFTDIVSSPKLWSPETPYLYSLHTLVNANGTLVDSVVESVGLRYYTWSAATPGGLFVNGTRTEVIGVCVSQWIGWMENAVPDSRWARIVGMVKEMGANSIRTAHYPRSEAFYHACDSIGILLLVECPNWGTWGGFSGLTRFWTNLYAADSEMVMDAYNHPSIFGWSLFNEPTETNLGSFFDKENEIVHGIEAVAPAGRVTCVSSFGSDDPNQKYPLDIYACNYRLSPLGSTDLPFLNTEYYWNFDRYFVRGNEMDRNVDNNSEAHEQVRRMTEEAWITNDKSAGGYFWCFMDYCSYLQPTGREGLVDRMYLPKNVYFMFRERLRGIAPDYWSNGTPTHIELKADLSTLTASGSDVSQIVATLRDDAGACKQTNSTVTFTVTSGESSVAMLYTGESVNPMSGRSSVTCAVEGGRAGIWLRTSTTPGNITITATNNIGLDQETVDLITTRVDETIPVLEWSGTSVHYGAQRRGNKALRLKTAYTGKGIMISFPSGVEKTVKIINCQGRAVAACTLKNGVPVAVSEHVSGSGIFYAVWDDSGRRMLTRLNTVQ